MSSKAEKRAKFEQVFNAIRDELIEYVKAQGVPQDAATWFTKVRMYVRPAAAQQLCLYAMIVIDDADARHFTRRTWTTTYPVASLTVVSPSSTR